MIPLIENESKFNIFIHYLYFSRIFQVKYLLIKMKLRGKKQNLTKEVMKQNNPDYSILTKNKKTSNISVNKEFSNLESNQTSHEVRQFD